MPLSYASYIYTDPCGRTEVTTDGSIRLPHGPGQDELEGKVDGGVETVYSLSGVTSKCSKEPGHERPFKQRQANVHKYIPLDIL